MALEQTQKVTPLYRKHIDSGASMKVFSGYEMPLWYSSARDEHLAVLTGAGLFDTCHMSILVISGPGAFELLQLCFSRDLRHCLPGNRPLSPQKSVYGVILNRAGHVVDDAVCSQTGSASYLLTVNAGMGGTIRQHFLEQGRGIEADIDDLTDTLGKIDLQGPESAPILGRILQDPESCFDSLSYFSFKGHFGGKGSAGKTEILLQNGVPVLVSRTGYTGEFGFELMVSAGQVAGLWDMLLENGEREGLRPCGLAARDSLRTGAVLPLAHQDIGDWPFLHNPWIFALPFTPDGRDFTKTFIGGESLLKHLQSGKPEYTYPFAGFDPRKISLDESSGVFLEEEYIGRVLTCTTDMGIGRQGSRIYSLASPEAPEGFKPRGLSCGFVKLNRELSFNQEITIQDARRRIPVMTVRDIRPDRTARKNLFHRYFEPVPGDQVNA